MMTLSEIKQEVNHLNLAERLLLVEEIWDAIAIDNSALPVSELQKRQLDERYAEYQAGSVKLHDWQAVHAQLRARYK